MVKHWGDDRQTAHALDVPRGGLTCADRPAVRSAVTAVAGRAGGRACETAVTHGRDDVGTVLLGRASWWEDAPQVADARPVRRLELGGFIAAQASRQSARAAAARDPFAAACVVASVRRPPPRRASFRALALGDETSAAAVSNDGSRGAGVFGLPWPPRNSCGYASRRYRTTTSG